MALAGKFHAIWKCREIRDDKIRNHTSVENFTKAISFRHSSRATFVSHRIGYKNI